MRFAAPGLTLLAALGLAVTAAPGAQADTVPTTWTTVVNKTSGKCIDAARARADEQMKLVARRAADDEIPRRGAFHRHAAEAAQRRLQCVEAMPSRPIPPVDTRGQVQSRRGKADAV